MADESKAYRVSLLDGSEAAVVHVPIKAPVTKKIRRHFQIARDLPDGSKKLEYEPREVEHTIDPESEMRADAIRAWNGSSRSFAARNLIVEPYAEPSPAPQSTVLERPKPRKLDSQPAI